MGFFVMRRFLEDSRTLVSCPTVKISPVRPTGFAIKEHDKWLKLIGRGAGVVKIQQKAAA